MDDVILQDKIEIILAGKAYKMKRISAKEVFMFAGMISRTVRDIGIKNLMPQDQSTGDIDEVTMGLILMAALTGKGEAFAEFYGSLLDMTADQFLTLSPEACADFLEQLPKHQDMRDFFQQVTRVMAAMGSLWRPA